MLNFQKFFFWKGIFAVDGVLWKKQRQIASPLFSVKELRHMVPVFIEHGKIVLKILEEASNNPNESFDLQNLFQRFTLDAILKVTQTKQIIRTIHSLNKHLFSFLEILKKKKQIAFGENLNCLETEPEFAHCFDGITLNLFRRTTSLIGRVKFYSLVFFVFRNKQKKKLLQKLDSFFEKFYAK